MPVPFLGRLEPAEYFALIGSFLLVGFEAVIRVLTLALRQYRLPVTVELLLTLHAATSLITLFYKLSSLIFTRLSTPAQRRAEERKKCQHPSHIRRSA